MAYFQEGLLLGGLIRIYGILWPVFAVVYLLGLSVIDWFCCVFS